MLSKSIKKWSIRKEKSRGKKVGKNPMEKNLNNHFWMSFEENNEYDIVNYHWFR